MSLTKFRAATDRNKPKSTRRIRASRRKQVKPSPAQNPSTLTESSASDSGEIAGGDLILVVDDTPTNLQILFGCLEEAGYRVLVCQNGENALEIAVSQQPDLILLDVLMPGIDGFETCKRLKEQPIVADIPIIFLTALSESTHKVRGFEAGGVDYVTKPIQQKELLARIKTHLQIQQMQRKLVDRNRQLQREVERREAIELELIERSEQLERLDQIKDRFLKTIAHELRSPMTRIKIGAQTLKKILHHQQWDNIPPNFDRVLQIFDRACDRQNELVDDLLSLAYLDERAQAIELETVDLNNFINSMVEGFTERIADCEQRLILNLPPEVVTIATDVEVLERILSELLTNAHKYTPRGEAIEIRLHQDNLAIEIATINTGVEISPDELPRIFEQFYRIPDRDPWQYGGTGLGLTIVKQFTELIGAEIIVTSEDLHTTFTLRWE
jgi:signal transduction histidine kinase